MINVLRASFSCVKSEVLERAKECSISLLFQALHSLCVLKGSAAEQLRPMLLFFVG